MKIDEILTEGPIDFAKKVKAGITGGKSGWQAQSAANKQADTTSKAANVALQKWASTAQNIKTSGQNPTPQHAVQWFTQFSGKSPTTPPPGVSNNQMAAWLKNEIANYSANKSMGITPVKTDISGLPDISSMTPEDRAQLRAELQSSLQGASISQPAQSQPAQSQPAQSQPAQSQPAQSRPQGGGKIPGQVSQTPGAVAKRQKRAQSKTVVNPSVAV